MRHKLIGFDTRELWLDVASQWTPAKRNSLLLKQAILKPLSVDGYVWYSVFSELLEPRLWDSVNRQPQFTGSEWNDVFSDSRKLSRPDDFRPRRLWTNLPAMRSYLQESWGNIWKPCYLIAVAELFGVDEEYESAYPIVPATISSEWQLLGYDVADYELYTGLFNGHMNGREAEKHRESWAQHLNEYHLFKDSDQGFKYIDLATQRYPSHAPFEVYALYGIQKYASI